jgi:hypothetical protein
MGIPELKNKIVQQLDSADERLLRIVVAVFDNYYKESISYDARGNALSYAEYNNKVEEGLKDVAYNRVVSQEKLSQEMKDWDNE